MDAICVFCSSSKYVDEIYKHEITKLAENIVKYEFDMVWGGADIGLMGHIARKVQEYGGYVRGVLPKSLLKIGLDYKNADELIITKGMSLRKNTMDQMSNGYICLPGGFGTLEEILEVITLKQLKYIDKPIVFLNISGYYDKFIKFIDSMIEEKFVKPAAKTYYFVTEDSEEAVKYIKGYTGIEIEDKW